METYTIEVDWTDWLTDDADDWDSVEALYMYATQDEPFYVGEAGGSSVRQRWNCHLRDGVVVWIRRHTKLVGGAKVGYLVLPPGINYSAQRLHDIQSLIIHEEHNRRAFCRANIANTKTRYTYRPGMVIAHTGEFRPLARRHHDVR